MEWFWLILVFAVAFAGTVVSTPLSMKLASLFDAIDYPDGRRVNTKPIPRLGGVAIFIGLTLTLGLVVIVNMIAPDSIDIRGINREINYYGVALAMTVIFLVGLIDDIYQVRPLVKLLGQIAAAIIACASGVLFSHFLNPFGPGVVSIGFFAYPFTVFYLVAFANIINLIDGLDGLASGVAIICASALLILSFSRGGMDATLVAIALIGACAGFLIFNFYPAKVFLGDSGALLLGFCLGLISLFGVVRTTALISLLIPVVIAGIPVIDTFSSIVRRIRSRKPVSAADKDHIHHRFINRGYSQRKTVMIIYGFSIILASLGLLIAGEQGLLRIVYAVLLLGVVAMFIWRMGLFSSVLTHHYEKRRGHLLQNDKQDEGEAHASDESLNESMQVTYKKASKSDDNNKGDG